MPSDFKAETLGPMAKRGLEILADGLKVTPAQIAETLHTSERVIKQAGAGEWDKLDPQEQSHLCRELLAYNREMEALETPFEKWARENPKEVAAWLAK